MSTPAWIPEIFAAVMVLVAEVSAGQLVIAHAWTRRGIADADIAVSRLLAGIAVAGLLVPGLSILPNAAWEVAFAVMTAWLAWRLWLESRGRGAAMSRGHYAPPLVQSAAMLYIFAAVAAQSVSSTGGMAGMAGWSSSGLPALHAPTLALTFVLLLVAFAVHDLDRRAGVDGYFRTVDRPLVPAGSALAAAASGTGPVPTAESAPQAGPAVRLLLSPAVVKGCQVTISVTMAFILIIMI
ncbi:MAG: DUF5134 domain-containing protein [Trebonia sp.]